MLHLLITYWSLILCNIYLKGKVVGFGSWSSKMYECMSIFKISNYSFIYILDLDDTTEGNLYWRLINKKITFYAKGKLIIFVLIEYKINKIDKIPPVL